MQAQAGLPGSAYWLLKDQVGSTTDLVAVSNGALQNHIVYDSFGNVQSQTNAAISTSHLFAGREFDQETGNYYNRARQYNAALGRFMSQDPISFAGGMNLYAYVGNDPLSYIDPWGLSGIGKIIIYASKIIMHDNKIIGSVTKGGLSFKQAVQQRLLGNNIEIGGNVCEQSKLRIANEIEEAANNLRAEKGDVIFHPKDAHKSGANKAHFQTNGAPGHSFVSSILVAGSLTTYFGSNPVTEGIDFFNPLSFGKDLLDAYAFGESLSAGDSVEQP